MRRHAMAVLCLSGLAGSIGGCSTLGYYAQAVGGQWELLRQRQPIDTLVADPTTPPSLRRRLRRVDAIRTFASDDLRLPDNGSYRSYADLRREAVVWSLVATPEFSVEPRQWCYPFVGCAAYRGYFSRSDAVAEAQVRVASGLDVALEPVPAYSTLGWFDDPLPSTVIDWPEPQLAGLIFHELAHQELYVEGDTAFNEGFATAVERIGVTRWLALTDPAGAASWSERVQREREFIELLLDARKRLRDLYAESLPARPMRTRKAGMFADLRERYRLLKRNWNGYSGFDRWFDRPLNNAHLATVDAYERWVPAFMALYLGAGTDMVRFYRAARQLAALPESDRTARLHQLLGEYARRLAANVLNNRGRGVRQPEKINIPALLVYGSVYRYRHRASRESSPSLDVVRVAPRVTYNKYAPLGAP